MSGSSVDRRAGGGHLRSRGEVGVVARGGLVVGGALAPLVPLGNLAVQRAIFADANLDVEVNRLAAAVLAVAVVNENAVEVQGVVADAVPAADTVVGCIANHELVIAVLAERHGLRRGPALAAWNVAAGWAHNLPRDFARVVVRGHVHEQRRAVRADLGVGRSRGRRRRVGGVVLILVVDVEELVRGSIAFVGNLAVGGGRDEGGGYLRRGRSGVRAEVRGRGTGDVRACHGRSGDGPRGVLVADPRGLDVRARREHVHARAVVAEGASRVRVVAAGDGGAAHRDGVRGVGGGEVARIGIAVTRGDHEGHAGLEQVLSLGHQRRGVAAAEGHGSDGVLVGVHENVVVRDPSHPRDDVGNGTRTAAVEDANAVEGRLGGDAVRGSQRGAGAVRAVAVAVVWHVIVIDKIKAGAHAVGVLDVVGVDAGVDDVDVNAGAGVVPARVVDSVERRAALSDAIQSPETGLEGGRDVDISRC